MSTTQGRILRPGLGVAPGVLQPLPPRLEASPKGRVVNALEVQATLRAEQIHSDALKQIARARQDAEAELIEQQLIANTLARAVALQSVVAQAVALQKKRQALLAANLDRTVDMAKLLAERLLGESLRLLPETIEALARQALREATGARHAILFAHPQDAAQLSGSWAQEPSILDSLKIESDPSLCRGQIRVETELGKMDADIGNQLSRLAEQLKKMLTRVT